MVNGSTVTVKVNYQGVRELLNSSEMQSMLQSRADEIRQRCGNGYTTDVYKAGTRIIASVSTGDYESMRDQAANNTILKALK